MRINFSKTLPILFLFITSMVNAQHFFHLDKFGKNRVQYEVFDWSYIETEHFELYYYGYGITIAKIAGEIAEREYQYLTETIGHAPFYKTKVLVYNSIQDLRQSNIGLFQQGYAATGQTNFIRSEVEVSFSGSKEIFEEEVKRAISDAFIFEMMYGGSLKDMIKSSYLLNLPNWFVVGASDYIARGWSREMDDMVRDFFSRHPKKFPNIRYIEGDDARIVGQSIWNYLVETYGKSNMASTLNLTKIIRDEKVAIQNTLGISYEEFIAGWKEFYLAEHKTLDKNYKDIDAKNRIKRNRKSRIYNKVNYSPEGTKLAYTENENGKYKINVYDLEKKKNTTVFKSGYKVVNQQIDYDVPLVDWISEDELVVFSQKKGQNYMWIYNLSKGGFNTFFRYLKRKIEFKFDHINDVSVSPDGKRIVMSAERRGQTDIYEHNVARRRTRQITKDYFDDLSPSYMNNSNDIIFSSNRTNDSTKSKKGNIEDITSTFNLYKYDKSKPTELQRLTNNLGKDFKPQMVNDSTVLFLSDRKGITNFFVYELTDSLTRQVSNFKYSIKDFSSSGKRVAFIAYQDEKEHMYEGRINPNKNVFTPKTRRQQIMDLRELREIKKKKELQRKRKEEEEKRMALFREQQKMKELKRIQDSIYQAKLEEDFLKETTEELDSAQSEQIVWEDTDSLTQEQETVTLEEKEEELVVQEEKPKVVVDPMDEEIDFDNFTFITSTKEKEEEANDGILPNKPTYSDNGKEANTDNYKFFSYSKNKRDAFWAKYNSRLQAKNEATKKKSMFTKSRDYETRFSVDGFNTNMRFDPLYGSGLQFEVMMTDAMENHKINAGLFGTFSLNNGNFFAEYLYLKRRVDFSLRFERNALEIEQRAQKYSKSYYEGGISLPVSIRSRIEFQPFLTFTRYSDTSLQPGLTVPDTKRFWTGFNVEYVFDNSLERGKNMLIGTRAKIRYENYVGLNDISFSFQNLSFDIRRYQKVLRSMTLALRASAGSFFGKTPMTYRLGGMDNWAFGSMDSDPRGVPRENQTIEEADLTHLFFTQFNMPMRGFNWNKWEGENYMLFNAELRMPVMKFLTKRPVKSKLLRDLQLTVFFDIGSAWTGVNPFEEDNSLNTEEISSGAFDATVKNFRYPFLMGHGVGARTTLLGYYLKLDVAWGIEDGFRQSKPKYYVTLGHDF
ncbi:PD40 domain-containing protein [Flammeovirga yaeyamensis]|nr:PD40 domain-containing protein [Flammeovirga yaeyamensis]